MPSIYSDEMRENILADFSSKNPKVSASIIERFGENPRSKGIGALEAEQYRAMVDAPLQSSPVMAWGGWRAKRRAGEKPFRDWFKNRSSVDTDLVDAELSAEDITFGEDLDTSSFDNLQPEDLAGYTPEASASASAEANPWVKGASGIVDAVFALANLAQAGKDTEAPTKAPRWRAPRTSEIKGVGGIGMALGGRPRRYEEGSEGGIQDPILEHGDPGLIETLRFLGLSDEAIVKFVNTVGDIPKSVADSAIYLGQKARDAGILEEPRQPDNGMNDGGTVLNRRLFLGGGEVDGIGGERDDLVPIWASDREYVVSANGVRRMGGGNHARGIEALDKVNNNGRLV